MTNGGLGRGGQILEGLMRVGLDRWGMEPEFGSFEYQEEDFGLGGWAGCSSWAVFGWWEGPAVGAVPGSDLLGGSARVE